MNYMLYNFKKLYAYILHKIKTCIILVNKYKIHTFQVIVEQIAAL